jgi:hypothetical protein
MFSASFMNFVVTFLYNPTLNLLIALTTKEAVIASKMSVIFYELHCAVSRKSVIFTLAQWELWITWFRTSWVAREFMIYTCCHTGCSRSGDHSTSDWLLMSRYLPSGGKSVDKTGFSLSTQTLTGFSKSLWSLSGQCGTASRYNQTFRYHKHTLLQAYPLCFVTYSVLYTECSFKYNTGEFRLWT